MYRGASPATGAGSAPVRALYDAESERATHGQLINAMLVSLTNLITTQEVFFAERGRYAVSIDELSDAGLATRLPDDVSVKFANTGSGGHWFIASHPMLRTACMIAVGSDWPMGMVRECG
jgi:hypothetical protein